MARRKSATEPTDNGDGLEATATEYGLIRPIDIDHEMQQAYLSYAMSVIVARALPDARDGLKPGPGEQTELQSGNLTITRLLENRWSPIRISDPGE